MTIFSPKVEIINHFDDLINRIDIDIDIDTCLEKYNDEVIGELLTQSEDNRRSFKNDCAVLNVKFSQTSNFSKQTLVLWSESTKVNDYLKQIRMRTIEELKKAQEETIVSKVNLDQLRS